MPQYSYNNIIFVTKVIRLESLSATILSFLTQVRMCPLYFIKFLFFHQAIDLQKLLKSVFYFILKALFVLEIFKFL